MEKIMSEVANEWARYAVVTYLASELGENYQFGKKALQKVVYLLQERKGVQLGFRYTFYTYGVFSAELASTVDVVQGLRGITAKFVPGENAYYLRKGEQSADVLAPAEEFLNEHKTKLEEIVEFAKGKSGKTLELISTIVFVMQSAEFQDGKPDDQLIERVHELKPKFDKACILRELNELRKVGNILSN
jgi:uncharacterized protein YwgA